MADNLGLFLLTWRLYRLLIVQSGSYFIGGWKPNMWPLKYNLLSNTFLSYCLFTVFFTLYGGSSFCVSFWTESLGVTIQMRATK